VQQVLAEHLHVDVALQTEAQATVGQQALLRDRLVILENLDNELDKLLAHLGLNHVADSNEDNLQERQDQLLVVVALVGVHSGQLFKLLHKVLHHLVDELLGVCARMLHQ
jgi:hypothetical protein